MEVPAIHSITLLYPDSLHSLPSVPLPSFNVDPPPNPMPPSATASLLRRSHPSIHRLSAAIQRLTASPAAQPDSNPQNGSLLKWVTGLTVGSALGVLYHNSCSPDAAEIDSDCIAYRKWSSSVAFADDAVSTASTSPRFLFGDAYRRKVFFNYEKRIRLRSPPEKVYQYFASFTNSDGEVLMTPADLMRAVVPVFPPSESNVIRDGYLRGEKCPGKLCCEPSEFFMLFDVDTDGLISFKEYIFFVTLLSIPELSFSVAFKMFDIDGNGEIDREEFKKVMTLMRSGNRQGSAQRDGLRAGVKVGGGSVENGGLVEYFFGKDGTKRLHHDTFVQFLRDLHKEILRLEFSHYDITRQGSISAKDFALSIVASADLKHVSRLLDQVSEIDKDPRLSKIRISEDEFTKFAELRKQLDPFSWALFSFGRISGLLTRKDFQRAASQVCGVDLSEDVVDIIFHVFDANRDGNLSVDEFVRVLERRQRDIAGVHVGDGIFGWLSCCANCAKSRSSISRFLF